MQMRKPTILILCTGNSCRSHLAEGILQKALGERYDVQSAGSKPAGYVHPLAIRVMKEIGIDISWHRSKHLDEFLEQPVETVITVCGNADQACPTFPGQANRYHWGFYDPARAEGAEEEKLIVFRRVRDEIRSVFEAYAAGRRDQARLAGASKPAATASPKPQVRLQVYDPAMCCSTGVCGPEVDSALVRFAADLKWLQEQGVTVERFNLAHCPMAFVENEQIKQALTDKGEAALPMLLTNGQVSSVGRYPDRSELAAWVGLGHLPSSMSQPSTAPKACSGAAAPNEQTGTGKCCG
jgi:arsenate reductase